MHCYKSVVCSGTVYLYRWHRLDGATMEVWIIGNLDFCFDEHNVSLGSWVREFGVYIG